MIRDALRKAVDQFINELPMIQKQTFAPRAQDFVNCIFSHIQEDTDFISRESFKQYLEDVFDWYQADDQPKRSLKEILSDLSSDLVEDHALANKYRQLRSIGESTIAGVSDEDLMKEIHRRFPHYVLAVQRKETDDDPAKEGLLFFSPGSPLISLWLLAGKAYDMLKATALAELSSIFPPRDPKAG